MRTGVTFKQITKQKTQKQCDVTPYSTIGELPHPPLNMSPSAKTNHNLNARCALR